MLPLFALTWISRHSQPQLETKHNPDSLLCSPKLPERKELERRLIGTSSFTFILLFLILRLGKINIPRSLSTSLGAFPFFVSHKGISVDLGWCSCEALLAFSYIRWKTFPSHLEPSRPLLVAFSRPTRAFFSLERLVWEGSTLNKVT